MISARSANSGLSISSTVALNATSKARFTMSSTGRLQAHSRRWMLDRRFSHQRERRRRAENAGRRETMG
jgi:hypothetical protein